MKYFLSFIITFTPIFINSQDDHDAKKLVEEVSSKISNAKTAVINFTFEQQEILYENGIIEIKDGKYRLTFMNVEQISDSKNIYTIIDENKEILISKISEEDNFLKPSIIVSRKLPKLFCISLIVSFACFSRILPRFNRYLL